MTLGEPTPMSEGTGERERQLVPVVPLSGVSPGFEEPLGATRERGGGTRARCAAAARTRLSAALIIKSI